MQDSKNVLSENILNNKDISEIPACTLPAQEENRKNGISEDKENGGKTDTVKDRLKEKYLTTASLKKVSSFLFSLLSAFFFLYVFGNMQDFLDESQLIILHILAGISVILFLVSFISFIFNILLYSQSEKKKFAVNFIFHIAMSMIGLASAFIYTSIIVISKGMI